MVARSRLRSCVCGLRCKSRFRLWNVVSICRNIEVISTSGFSAMLTLNIKNMSPIVDLDRILMAWCYDDFGFGTTLLSLKLAKLLLLPGIVRRHHIRQEMMSPTVT